MRLFASIPEFFRDNYPSSERLGVPVARWRQSIYRTVFESNTEMGKRFERRLTLAIILSLCVVSAHSIPSIAQDWRLYYLLRALEWVFTLGFTVEYALRLISVRHPLRYALSFYGLVDLLAIVPTYLGIFFPEAHFLVAVRALRLVRTFHVFPVLRNFLDEYLMLGQALKASARKIFVFLSVVALIVFVMGTLMYVIEGPEHGFTSVPLGIYWAISTVTTVGYGDVTPSTAIGRIFASIMMLLGWGVLAVPTGIVGAELSRSAGTKARLKGVDCEVCGLARHEDDSRYCRRCGSRLQLPGAARAGATPTAPATAAQPAGAAAPAPSRQDKASATEAETA
ncbi:ion transporter [Comamonas avium]|uniref:Ion transporter n=1 Tax=Comamonas avium TaxID=2762231 RepID=A0ABR8S6P2_9BURK|nr:ion transporter [Comamonas avium]MBD7959115.1 ion transporter [Comamonas avium]